MFRNVAHPDYDLAMELLCLLPPITAAALRTTVADDLGLSSTHRLSPLIRELERLDIHVCGANGNPYYPTSRGHRCIWLGSRTWSEAKALAQEYWDTVYGEDQ